MAQHASIGSTRDRVAPSQCRKRGQGIQAASQPVESRSALRGDSGRSSIEALQAEVETLTQGSESPLHRTAEPFEAIFDVAPPAVWAW